MNLRNREKQLGLHDEVDESKAHGGFRSWQLSRFLIISRMEIMHVKMLCISSVLHWNRMFYSSSMLFILRIELYTNK